jgi:hypothetical protein
VTWLLKLYPRAWRRRYGDEVATLVTGQPFSIAVVIDLIAGAIDVWLHPGVTMAAAMASSGNEMAGGNTMLARALRFDCSAGFTRREQWQSGIATIAGTIVLTLGWMWLHARIGDNSYVDAFSALAFVIPILMGVRFTYLKDRPFSVYVAFVLTMTALVAGFLAAIGGLASLL